MAITWIGSSVSSLVIEWQSLNVTREVDSEKTLTDVDIEAVNEDGMVYYFDEFSLQANLSEIPEDPTEPTGTLYQFQLSESGAGSTFEIPVFNPYEEAKINAVWICYKEAITGNDSNNFTLKIINRGADGITVGNIVDQTYVTGENEAAYVMSELTINSTYSSLEKQGCISIKKEESGGGLKMPACNVSLFWDPNISA